MKGINNVKKEQIEETILQGLRHLDQAVQVHASRSSLGWIRLHVTSRAFSGLSNEERELLVDQALAAVGMNLGMYPFAGYALLTPEESNGRMAPPLIQLPLWSDILLAPEWSRAEGAEEKAETPLIVAFYSFKGGVGRSTAMAVTAGLLAEADRRVVMIDFDLEAPGLSIMLPAAEGADAKYGVLDYVHQRWLTPDEDFPPIADCIRRIASKRGDLFLVPAGNYDENYIHRLADFDVERLYRREPNPIHQLVQDLGAHLAPDVILIDARTGFDDTGAVALFDLADLGIICFAPNEQSYRGLEWVIKAARKQRDLMGNPDLRFVLTPMPPVDRQKREEWITLAEDRIADLWGIEGDTIVEDMRVIVDYQPAVAVAENILLDLPEALRVNYRPLADFIDAALPDSVPPVPLAANKAEILNQLQFKAVTANQIEAADIPDIFQRTGDFPKFLSDRTAIIRGAKGTGKSLLFRLFVEQPEKARELAQPHRDLTQVEFVAGHGRQALDHLVLSSDDFASYEAQVGEDRWQVLWSAYALLRIAKAMPASPIANPALQRRIDALARSNSTTHQDIVAWLVEVAQKPADGPAVSDALRAINRWLARERRQVWLLYDELDAGFGAGAANYARRRRALEALLAWWLEIGDTLTQIHMKCLIRDDIWRGLNPPNKSHYTGRDMALQWQEEDLWRLVLRQALNSSAFATRLRAVAGLQKADLEKTELARLQKALHSLWGERMGRGKKAYTHRWVLKRIADAQNNRFPRSLILLLDKAIENEKAASATQQETVLRPRSLQDAMPHVSEGRVAEVRDEYPEFEAALEALRGQSSPLSRDTLAELWSGLDVAPDELTDRMIQAGILEKRRPGDREDAPRYAIAELYLSGLGMRRKGQR